MSDMMSITDMLARLRADAASEQFEGARLGPIAVRELLRHVDSLVAEVAFTARQEREEGGAPHVDDAYYMGATGGEATDGERLAFESWMRGHCWALCATWSGTAYRSDAEQGGNIDPRAMRTRQLWAAWRDRAALADLKAPNAYDARQPAGTYAQDQQHPRRCGPEGCPDSTACPREGGAA